MVIYPGHNMIQGHNRYPAVLKGKAGIGPAWQIEWYSDFHTVFSTSSLCDSCCRNCMCYIVISSLNSRRMRLSVVGSGAAVAGKTETRSIRARHRIASTDLSSDRVH